MSIQDIKSFNRALNSVVRRTTTLRADVQSLVVFAHSQVAMLDADGNLNANLTPLSDLILKTKPLRTIRTATLEAYVMAHISGIEWKGKGKEKRLAKIDGATIECKDLDGLWYDFDNEGIDAKECNVIGRIKNLLRDIDKAEREDGLVFVAGQEKLAKSVATLLAPFTEDGAENIDFDVSVGDELEAGVHVAENGELRAVGS